MLLRKPWLLSAATMSCLFYQTVYAAQSLPVFPDQPLATSVSAYPNIMFVLDSSGSMNFVLPDVPFDANQTYFSCPANLALNESTRTDIRVTAGGKAYFKHGYAYYDWGTTSGNGHTGRSKRCFKNNASYRANLYGSLGFNGTTKYPVTYTGGQYSGNYLNWYFGSTPTSWGSNARLKPATKTRMTVAKESLSNLISTLKGARAGLSTFNALNGANIRIGIDDIDKNRSQLLSEISNVPASGSTPLAETLQGIGRYFVEGHNQLLTLKPDSNNPQTAYAYQIFNNGILHYLLGVPKASPIQAWCQKNFVVMLTDGQPTSDNAITSYLRTYPVGANGADDTGFYLDNVAKALYDIDLRPDLVDNNGNPVKNNVSTYTIGFADPALLASPLLANTALNGGGLFLTATNAAELNAAFTNATESILGARGISGSVSFNASTLAAGSAMYAAYFQTDDWSGSLERESIDGQGNMTNTSWNASTQLDNRNPASRVILTYNADTNQGVSFSALNNLSQAQQNDLNKGPLNADGHGAKRLAYLRGDKSDETTLFRKRAHIMGDIVHSSPMYIAEPTSRWPDIAPFPTSAANKYSTFKANQGNRTPVVYVGANDGMLHAFNATENGGQELLAYIPAMVFSDQNKAGMHYLTDPDYQHKFYVDLSPTVGDAFFKSRGENTARWHTVLLGGMRSGAKGMFAIDITNPANFTAANANKLVLWEFSDKFDANLGYNLSRPVIGKLNNGRWAAIFGNGYSLKGDGCAQLFIVYLDGGQDGTWTKGKDYIVLDTKKGGPAMNNGLSAPSAVDLNGDHVIDRIYAGDLQGNLWAFDLSANTASGWKVAYGKGAAPLPLFNAHEGSHKQAITAAPVVVRHPKIVSTPDNAPNLMIYFGTGQFVFEEDKATTTPEAFYGIWDEGVGNLESGKLVKQDMTTSGDMRTMSNRDVNYDPAIKTNTAQKFGWEIDLEPGERVTVSSTVRDGLVYFDTQIPSATAICGYGGTGWLMAVDMLTGGQPNHSVYDVNHDNIIDDQDKVNNSYISGIHLNQGIPGQSSFKDNYQFTATSDGKINIEQLTTSNVKSGRISWRQLFQP